MNDSPPKPVSTGHTRRIAGLDLVRAVAITSVVVAHGSVLWQRGHDMTEVTLWHFGGYGVDVFFALSGWLIGGQLYDAIRAGTFSLWGFWRRRWLRTVPAYLVFLVIGRWIHLRHWTDDPWMDWRYLLYVQNLTQPHPRAFVEAWSLSVEEWFYLSVPLLLLVCVRVVRHRLWLAFVGVAGVLAIFSASMRGAYIAAYDYPTSGLGSLLTIVIVRLDAIAMGLGAVALDRAGFFSSRSVRWVLLGLGGLLWAFGLAWVVQANASGRYQTDPALQMIIPVLFCFATALLLPACARLQTWPWRFPGWCASKLALISYSMYLCNFSVMQATGKAGDMLALPLPLQGLIYGVVTVSVGWISYHWIERYFIRLYRREPEVERAAPV